MVRSLNAGISGLQQSQQRMDVISNNIANVNTTGFKAGRVQFADAFSQTLQGSSAANGTVTGTPAMQIGTGVSTESIQNVYSQGSISRTGYETDLAISGEGYFIVKDPTTNTEYATRAGDFRRDSQGYLVTSGGLRVQGYSDGGATRGDIRIDATGNTSPAGAEFTSFTIGEDGTITVNMSAGAPFKRGQILLQRFNDQQALMKEGANLYSGLAAAGPLAQSEVPNTNGLGQLQSGSLELSNVDLATEFTSMITTQRGFQANSRVITTTDEMLQELVNLKR